MKKTIFIASLAIFSLSATTTFAILKEQPVTLTHLQKSLKKLVEASTENATEVRLTTEEINDYKTRVEEIRDMDKSEMSSLEKKELKSELKDIKATMRSQPYIYIGGTTLLLIILLLILL